MSPERERQCHPHRIHFQATWERGVDPSGPVQIGAISSPVVPGDTPAFLRILGMSQTSDDPRSLFSWSLLSPHIPNQTPILSSSIVSILRLTLTGSPGPHIHFHFGVC